MKKLILSLSIAFSSFFLPAISHAVCTQSGSIVRVTAYADGVSNNMYVYLKTTALSTLYYYCITTDDNLAEIATDALTSVTHVSIQGDTASCSTTGTGRSMGNCRYIVVNP